MSRIVKLVRKFFCEFDMFSSPATLRINEDPEMKTCFMGFLSFVLACFFFYVFLSGSVQMLNFQKIDSTESRTTIRSNQTNGKFKYFAVCLDFLLLEDFYTMFQFRAYHVKNGSQITYIPLKKCEVEDWNLLGDNYKQDFNSYYLQYMLCPNTTIQFSMNDTFRSDTPDYIQIVLSGCDATDPNCDLTQAENLVNQYVADYKFMEVWVYVLDKAISPSSKNPVSYFINIDSKVQFTSKFGGGSTIEFSTFKIETDVNVMPWQQKQTQQGCFVDTVRNYQIQLNTISTDILAIVRFTMNQKRFLVERQVGKVDELLSYAGGLFSIIMGFFAIFLQSYNEYKYELMAAEGAFNYDESGRQINANRMNFFIYVKYSIFDWINALFCCSLAWKDCLQIDETREQIVNHLQTDRLFRRINNIQISLKMILDRSQRICLCLVSPPTLDEAKEDRIILDYYKQITSGRCPSTLSQVSKILQQSKLQSTQTKNDLSLFKSSNMATIHVKKIRQLNMQQSEIDIQSNQFDRVEDRIQLVYRVLQQNFEIRKQADQIVLQDQFINIEQTITKEFFALQRKKRMQIQQKIPIHILYRLLKRHNNEI